jgi:UDP-N-acetylglucosamine acyltransferase
MSIINSIHKDAKIGSNVQIGAFTTIYGNVEIGDGTWIGPNVTIMDGARIGKNVKIYPGAVISADPQDLKYNGENTTAEIGDNTVIREFVTLNKGTTDKYATKVGRNCLLMAYVHVGHDCEIGNYCIIANSVQLAGHIIIEDNARLGGTVAVHQFVKIGAHVMVAGGSLVRKDIPPFTTAGREPLSYCGINSIGLRRRGYTSEKINEIQEIYRHIYLSGLNNSKALDRVSVVMPVSKERDEIINFFKSSDRGVMRGYQQR